MPSGPQTVGVAGQTTDVVSTYTVSLADNDDNFGYVFSPDGLTQNPTIKLFRGITYKLDINTPGLPFTIRTKRDLDDAFLLPATQQIDNQGTESSTITFTPGSDTPDILYYVADNDINAVQSMGMMPQGFVVNNFLTDTNAFFIKTDVPNGLKMFVRSPVKTTMEGDFETGNVRYKARERYSFGFSDPRGIFGSPGAA